MTSTTHTEYGGGLGRRVKMGPYNYETTATGNNAATATSSDTKSGVSNPSWRRQVRQALNATTPYTRSVVDDGLFWGSYSATFQRRDPFWPGAARYDNCYEVCGGAVANNPRLLPPALPSLGTVDVDARIAFLQRARAVRQNFQGGVFLGELREAIHMVARPGKALREAVTRYSTAAKKAVARARNLKQASSAVTGTWLEAMFGWRPLLSDVDSAMKALAATNTLIVEVLQGSAKADWYSSVGRDENRFSGSTIGYKRTYRAYNKAIVRYKGGVGWESANQAPSWRENWGLTLDNFVPTVYELIPYSFLIDYFSNLGKIIDSASFGTVSVRWGCKSAVQSSEMQISHELVDRSTPGQDIKWRQGAFNVHKPKLGTYFFSRTPIGGVSVGISDLQFRCPGVGSTKWLNIGALAFERSAGKLRY